MRKASRIYRRKTRSNLETLIILVGAIIILGVAFHLARERSYIPPEEPLVVAEQKEPEVKSSEKKETEIVPEITVEKTEDEKIVESKVEEKPSVSQQIESTSLVVEEKPAEIPVKKEVTVSIEDSKTSRSKVYTVQVGAFSTEKNAQGLALEIQGKGFNTFIVKGGNLYKVQVGEFKSYEEAQSLSNKLKEMGYPIFVTTR